MSFSSVANIAEIFSEIIGILILETVLRGFRVWDTSALPSAERVITGSNSETIAMAGKRSTRNMPNNAKPNLAFMIYATDRKIMKNHYS